MPQRPLAIYRSLIEAGHYQPDPPQRPVVEALDGLWQELTTPRRVGWVARLRRAPAPVRGLYIWGGVGRGKTWLMDLFYESLPRPDKFRIHFHRFMARVHAALRERESLRNPLDDVAREWAGRYRVLCFDEFHVSDIADAMLLGGLLAALFRRGVVLVATSNLAPGSLYRDGLQRARFLPAIDLLERHTRVVELAGDIDFRLRILERSEIYHSPLDEGSERALEHAFERFSGGYEMAATLQINGRPFRARRRADGVVWFDFAELCGKARGSVDYIEIARSFNTVLLSGIPVMGPDMEDPARRFVHLVDELYDRNVKLLVTAAAPARQLYAGRRLELEFQRTASRLAEMQGHDYLALPHLP